MSRITPNRPYHGLHLMDLILKSLNHKGLILYDSRLPGNPILLYEATRLTNDELEALLHHFLQHLDD